MQRALVLAALAGLGWTPVAQFQVWTVDDDGPADFASVQDAIDAAQDGDALLIRGGTYGHALIDAKRLTLIGGDGGVVSLPDTTPLFMGLSSQPGLRVQNLTSDRPVTLVGLNLATTGGGSANVGIDAVDSQGVLWIQDCIAHGVGGATADDAYLVVRDSGFVGDYTASWFGTAPGGDGLAARGSVLRIYGSVLAGSIGKDAGCIIGSSCGTGQKGGDGLSLGGGSSAHLSGILAQGGPGENSYCDSVSWGDAGSGGDGIHADLGSQALAIDTLFQGGHAGTSFTVCSDGLPGVAQSGAGSIVVSPHVRRSLAVTGIVREGETVDVTITAPAGEGVFVGIATTPGELQDPLIDGPLILGSQPAVLPMGAMPATGQLLVSFPAPDLPPGVDFFTLYLQAAFAVAPGVGIAGDPMALVILDSSF